MLLTITGFNPQNGPVGTRVTIDVTGLPPNQQDLQMIVYFNQISAGGHVERNGANQVVAEVPGRHDGPDRRDSATLQRPVGERPKCNALRGDRRSSESYDHLRPRHRDSGLPGQHPRPESGRCYASPSRSRTDGDHPVLPAHQ